MSLKRWSAPRRPCRSRSPHPPRRLGAMFELMLCSLFTLVPDYVYRRYVQGKRIGHEITLYSMWFELRWGITGCVMLTVLLITMIFYFHPSTSSAALFFRTVPIVPEGSGRVAEVNADFSAPVKKGDVLFTLDSSKQQAAVETSKRKIVEVDAQLAAAKVDVVKAEAQLQQANSDYKQAKDELDGKSDLQKRTPGIVPQRDIERLQVVVDGRPRCAGCPETGRRGPGIHSASGFEGKRRGGIGAGSGRTRQDRDPCRRRW